MTHTFAPHRAPPPPGPARPAVRTRRLAAVLGVVLGASGCWLGPLEPFPDAGGAPDADVNPPWGGCADGGAGVPDVPPNLADSGCPSTWLEARQLCAARVPCEGLGPRCAYPGAGDELCGGAFATAVLFCSDLNSLDGGAGEWVCAQ